MSMNNTGFAAVGVGALYTIGRLLFLTHKREDPLDKSLYDVFDAKFSAELAAGVGVRLDAWVIYLDVDRKPKVKVVEKNISELIESVWYHKAALSPYEEPQEGDVDPPPQKWKAKLKKYVEDFMPAKADQS